jgi:cell division protein FtsL
MKHLAILGGLVAIGLAVGVYRAKLGAEETSARIDQLKAEIVEVEQDISVLRAEEAYLSRPERIGPLAREKLGLEPTLPSQFTAGELLRSRIGEERQLAPDAASLDQKAATAAPAQVAPVE